MNIEISARHFTLGDKQRDEITGSMEKLEKFSPRPVQSMKLTVTHDAGQFTADAVLHINSHDFRAKGVGAEPELAANEASDNLRKQLAKHKGKTSGKQNSDGGGLGRAVTMDLNLTTADLTDDHAFELKNMDVESAKDSFISGDHPFLIFRNTADSRVGVIYRDDAGSVVHMGERA
ncbi:MAG: ribosomal subunit interface protein [Candidatus Krumholzibacteriia bacterium]|jgi:ribosomal subunit interface protein